MASCTGSISVGFYILTRKHPVAIETLYALVELISEYKRHSLTEYVFPIFMNSTFCNTVYKSTKLNLEK